LHYNLLLMARSDIKNKEIATVPAVTVVKKMRDYSKEPFFVKKKEDAMAFLEKYGLPDGTKFKRKGSSLVAIKQKSRIK
jgi:hypothetical protein